MSSVYRYRINPQSPFHLGHGPSLTETDLYPRSDTLGGALFGTAARLGKESWMDEVINDDSFAMSSVFPFLEDEITLLPFPLDFPNRSRWLDVFPQLSSARWIQESIVVSFLAGNLDANPQEYQVKHGVLCEESTWSDHRGLPVARSEVHNSQDRLTGQTVPFKRQDVTYGHWKLTGWIRLPDSCVEALPELMNALGRKGLGGERSSGRGKFEFDEKQLKEVAWRESKNRKALLLSLYCPSDRDVEEGVLDSIQYRTEKRSGWIETHGINTAKRKRSVRMLTEGSVIETNTVSPEGRAVDVAPSDFDRHPVYRFGRPILYGGTTIT